MDKFKKEQYIKQRYSEKSNSWSFQVNLKCGEHTITKTFSEKVYGSPRRAYDNAIIYRNKKLHEIGIGSFTMESDKTLEEVFYESFSVLPIREETKRKHIIYFNKYIKQDILIRKVNRLVIMQSLNALISTCSDDLISRVFSVWKRIFKTALICEYVSTDQTLGIVVPTSKKPPKAKKEVIVSRETLDEVIRSINNKYPQNEAKCLTTALELMWYCGLRPCECFALLKDDIKDGYINVDKELGSDITDNVIINRENLNVIRRCKTDASIRKVPIPSKLQVILDDYKVNGDILFPNPKGSYYRIKDVGQKIHSLGIEFNMYQLRHTVATRLVTNSVDQRTIVEILGHEHIDMSVYYARSNEELKRNALDI